MATIIAHINSALTEEQRKTIEDAIKQAFAAKVSCEILHSDPNYYFSEGGIVGSNKLVNKAFENFVERMRILENNKTKDSCAKTSSIITVGVVVAGMHRYPESTRSYLREFHRHDFKISVNIGVTELNRQYEFYDVQDGILETLNARFPKVDKTTYNFGNRSCEHIANELFPILAKKYPVLNSIAVFEDEFNGSTVIDHNGLIVPPGDK